MKKKIFVIFSRKKKYFCHKKKFLFHEKKSLEQFMKANNIVPYISITVIIPPGSNPKDPESAVMSAA